METHKFRVILEVTRPAADMPGDMFDWEEQVARSLVANPFRGDDVTCELVDVRYQTPYPEEEGWA